MKFASQARQSQYIAPFGKTKQTCMPLSRHFMDIEVVNTVDRVTVLALCFFADGPLSMYQVSFNPLVIFQRYSPDKLFIEKMKKGSDSIYTVDRVMVFTSCNFADGTLSMYQVSFNSLIYFQIYAPEKLLLQKLTREVTP